MKVTDEYVFFYKGQYSQWHACWFRENNTWFNCAEQYMMYKKALLFEDLVKAALILNSNHPSEHQKIGRMVSNYDQKIWDDNKSRIVYEGNLLKFKQNPFLKKKMLEMGSRIFVEASPVDRIWGVGLREDDPLILDPDNWRGQNLLGEALTKVKSELYDDHINIIKI